MKNITVLNDFQNFLKEKVAGLDRNKNQVLVAVNEKWEDAAEIFEKETNPDNMEVLDDFLAYLRRPGQIVGMDDKTSQLLIATQGKWADAIETYGKAIS